MLDDHKIAASSTEEARSVDPNSDYEFFGKHEIKSGIQLPCYKESHGKWMVPITILQKVFKVLINWRLFLLLDF